jgi:cell division protein ZapA (FtsZ GTPase activity inhibitor)
MESLKVKVFGDEYALRCADKELTASAAERVAKLAQEFKQKALELSSQRIAVLTAIHFAEKYLELEKELAALRAELESVTAFAERLTTSADANPTP